MGWVYLRCLWLGDFNLLMSIYFLRLMIYTVYLLRHFLIWARTTTFLRLSIQWGEGSPLCLILTWRSITPLCATEVISWLFKWVTTSRSNLIDIIEGKLVMFKVDAMSPLSVINYTLLLFLFLDLLITLWIVNHFLIHNINCFGCAILELLHTITKCLENNIITWIAMSNCQLCNLLKLIQIFLVKSTLLMLLLKAV